MFGSEHSGSKNVWAIREKPEYFRRSNHEPAQLTTGPMYFDSAVPSLDGKEVFVLGTVLPRAELRRYDPRTGKLVPYLGGMSAWWLDFSADGKWLAYLSFPEDTLWRSKADGSDPVQLTSPPMQAQTPRWSPDGRQIVFTARESATGRSTIYLIPAEGGQPEPVSVGDEDAWLPDWASDGKRIVFVSNEASQAAEVKVVDLPTRQLSTVPGPHGLSNPRWSPNGRYLVASDLHAHAHLYLFDFSSQTWKEIVGLHPWRPRWSADSQFVYFFAGEEGEEGIYRIRVSDRKVERVVNLKGLELTYHRDAGCSYPAGTAFTLAPDGSLALTINLTKATQEIYALEWAAP